MLYLEWITPSPHTQKRSRLTPPPSLSKVNGAQNKSEANIYLNGYPNTSVVP